MKTKSPNKITRANAGGPRQLSLRTRWVARVAQFCRSVSLMPPGLTAPLRRDELIDLMRFLTSMGKKDEPAK